MIGHDSVFTRGRVIMSAYLRWVGFPANEIDDLKRCRYAFFVFVGIHFWKIKSSPTNKNRVQQFDP